MGNTAACCGSTDNKTNDKSTVDVPAKRTTKRKTKRTISQSVENDMQKDIKAE